MRTVVLSWFYISILEWLSSPWSIDRNLAGADHIMEMWNLTPGETYRHFLERELQNLCSVSDILCVAYIKDPLECILWRLGPFQ